jgi:hypothetical protein
MKLKYTSKLKEIENTLQIWFKQILTPIGKITITKSLIISKLNHSQKGLFSCFFYALSLIAMEYLFFSEDNNTFVILRYFFFMILLIQLHFKPLIYILQILTPIGKITITKSLIISKLNHLFLTIPSPKENIINQLVSKIYSFIWDNKPDKIKREVWLGIVRNK